MKSGKFMALDIGEDGIQLAEFVRHAHGQLELLGLASARFESDHLAEMAKEAVLATTLKRLLDEMKPTSRSVLVALDGQSVFSRLVKLPPAAADKLEQTIRNEAMQNIPFPLGEVVWDHQLMNGVAGEPEVLLVAAKRDLVDGVVHSIAAAGLSPEQIDVGPAALGNAVRHTCPDLDVPVLVVDIGTQASSLIFIDGGRTLFRTLPVSAQTAERLIQEIGRAIIFYRNQQEGAAPGLILLAGCLEGFDAFDRQLADRLKLPVQFFDPLKGIGRAASVEVEHPHRCGILVGLAVHRCDSCALEIDLLPEAQKKQRGLRRRQPMILAYMALGVLIAGVWAAGLLRLAQLAGQESVAVGARVAELEQIAAQLDSLEAKRAGLENRGSIYGEMIARRTAWLEALLELRSLLPEGMFLLEVEPIREERRLAGIRFTALSYLDRELPGQDAVKLLRDRLHASPCFNEETQVVKRPTKQSFARSFTMDAIFEETPRP